MNVFVPYPNVIQSVKFLDNSRLNKQVSECAQILRTIMWQRTPWSRHPATLMWHDNLEGLAYYMHEAEAERLVRGMNPHAEMDNVTYQLALTPNFTDLPWWWGNAKVHDSHLANLQLKFQGLPHGEYFWPVRSIKGKITLCA